MLDRIRVSKLAEIEAARASVPIAELQAKAADMPPTLGFARALHAAQTPALIAEIKKASPSQGVIRADFDPAAIAADYAAAGAAALSVLTDREFFQGAPENIVLAKAATGLPVLRKDFILDEYQIWEARAWGADAILLIASMLDRERIEALGETAARCDLDVVLEVHDEAEAKTAIELGADPVGVNNRNLKDFTTSLRTTERLAPMLRPSALVISESGLETRADVDRAVRAGVKAVLIGTVFCAAPDIRSKVKEVMGW